MNGAKVVAKAWTDPEYRARLLADGTAAIAELGFKGPQGEHIVVLENSDDRAPRRRVHPVLLLPVAGARAAAELVQGPRLPLPDGAGAARRAGRDGPELAEDVDGPGLGLQRRRCATSCCPSGPAGTDGLSEEELAGARHPRRHGRAWRRWRAGAVTAGSGARRRGPGRPAALQRRAGLRRAVGEPGVRPGRHPRTTPVPSHGTTSAAHLVARIAAWEHEHPRRGELRLLRLLAAGAGAGGGGHAASCDPGGVDGRAADSPCVRRARPRRRRRPDDHAHRPHGL